MANFTLLWVLVVAMVVAGVSAGIEDWDPDCITEPVGFGNGTFGGAGGEIVYPKNIKQLKNYLKDDIPRIILLNKTFDFTESEGSITEEGCYFKQCGEGFQYSLVVSDTCDGRVATQVDLDKAGKAPLNIGSFKTIMGVGGRGVIRGKGLKIRHAEQVIIRDIAIVDINPHVIWGGDALAINGVNQAWIHNVTFRNIGRQFIVTYQTSNTGITISSCTFDGNTPNAPFCDNKHYWVWLFWGTDDQITIINNRIINTSGRLPHAGGYDQAKTFIHIVGNYFDSNSDVALEPWDGAFMLVEGNQYSGMRRLVNERASNGNLYLVNSARQARTCEVVFGERCLRNQYRDTRPINRCDETVLAQTVAMEVGVDAVNSARQAVCVPPSRRPQRPDHGGNEGSSSSSSSSSEENEDNFLNHVLHF